MLSHLKLVKHVEQIFYQRSVDELTIALSFNEHQNAGYATLLNERMIDDVRFEQVETEIPDGEDERIA